jgi:D-xylose 1-dehydrogenase
MSGLMGGAIYPDLAGMPVLITGGASGIGAELTRHFAAQKARVAIVDINPDRLSEMVAQVQGEFGLTIAARVVDLRDIPAMQAAFTALAGEVGTFRALLNNAGDDARLPQDQVTPEYWDDRMAVNLRHQFFAAQALAPGMAEAGGGSIINFGSISWMFGAAGLIAYTTAKSAIMGLTKSLARELGGKNIRVNSIAPGMIWTEKQIARAKADDPAKFQSYLDRQCIKHLLEPADIARLALWLASAESRHASGQTYILDGGVV